MSITAVCVSSAPRPDLSRLFKHKREGFRGVSRCCAGGRGGLTLGLGTNIYIFEKYEQKMSIDPKFVELTADVLEIFL